MRKKEMGSALQQCVEQYILEQGFISAYLISIVQIKMNIKWLKYSCIFHE